MPFNALCVASRVAAIDRVTARQAKRHLWEGENELGGEVVEDEVLWLPAERFAQLQGGLVVVLAAADDVAVAEIPAGGLLIAADGGAQLALDRGDSEDGIANWSWRSFGPRALIRANVATTGGP